MVKREDKLAGFLKDNKNYKVLVWADINDESDNKLQMQNYAVALFNSNIKKNISTIYGSNLNNCLDMMGEIAGDKTEVERANNTQIVLDNELPEAYNQTHRFLSNGAVYVFNYEDEIISKGQVKVSDTIKTKAFISPDDKNSLDKDYCVIAYGDSMISSMQCATNFLSDSFMDNDIELNF